MNIDVDEQDVEDVEDPDPWERMTLGTMQVLVNQLLGSGVPSAAVLCADSDPEGNGLHPLRLSIAFGHLTSRGGVHAEFDDLDPDGDITTATAVVIGVGY